MAEQLVCWKCGSSIAALPLPLSRYARCLSCGADLHVCRMCRFHEPTVAQQCREPIADEVSDKERANYCECFQVRPDAFGAGAAGAAEAARTALEALFEPPAREV